MTIARSNEFIADEVSATKGIEMPRKMLIIDDDQDVLDFVEFSLLTHLSGEVVIDIFKTPQQALAACENKSYMVILADLGLPGMSGLDFLKLARASQPFAVPMILSGATEFKEIQRAVNEVHIYQYIVKPWHPMQLAEHVEGAFDHYTQQRRLAIKAEEWDASQGVLTPQEAEARRLERLEPGITKVSYASDGSIII